MTDYYKALGVTAQADEKEIKTAYRKLAKKYHPDAIRDNPALKDKMYEIQAAYEVLGDPARRKKYDEQRRMTKSKKTRPEENGPQRGNPNMSQFEQFFGFQPGKGMETYRDKKTSTNKAKGPIRPEDLFAAYFGKGK